MRVVTMTLALAAWLPAASALAAARAEIRSILARLRSGEIGREEARALVEDVHLRLIETLSQFLTEEQIDRLLHPRPGKDRPDLDLSDEQLRREPLAGPLLRLRPGARGRPAHGFGL